MPDWRLRRIDASDSRDISTGITQREAPSPASKWRVCGLKMFRVDPATNGNLFASSRTAPMSLASTRKFSFSAILRRVLTSYSDSIRVCVEITTSLPARSEEHTSELQSQFHLLC